jgi:uncharacterized protein (DUF2336 family)
MNNRPSIIQELEEVISHGPAGRRAETLSQIMDLFVCGALQYSDDQIALFDDVVGFLAADMETAARAELSTRLAPISNAPPKVIRNLAYDDEIAVAGPVLMHSERLNDETLIDISKKAGQRHLLAISQRTILGEAVTDVLLERGDSDIVHSVAANAGARFSPPGYSTLVQRAEGDDQITACVGARPDLPRHLFLQLLAKASEAVRERLEQADAEHAHEIRQIVASVTTRMAAEAAAISRDYRAARAHVRALHASGKLGETDVDGFAKAGKFEEATVALALFCGVSVETVERAMMQERPEMLMILGRAAGLSWPTVKSFLRLRSGGMSAHDLEQCFTNFHALKQSTAQQVIRVQRIGGPRNADGMPARPMQASP